MKKIIAFVVTLTAFNYLIAFVCMFGLPIIDGNESLYSFNLAKILMPYFPFIAAGILFTGTLIMWCFWKNKMTWTKKLVQTFSTFIITFLSVGYFNPSIFITSVILPLSLYTFSLGGKYEMTSFAQNFNWKNFAEVKVGMEKDELIRKIGEPLQIDDKFYTYSKQGDSTTDYWVVRVKLENNKVISPEVYYWMD